MLEFQVPDTVWVVARAVQWLSLWFFLLSASVFAVLNLLSLVVVIRHMKKVRAQWMPRGFKPLQPPVSLLVPAYNESVTVVATVHSLLELDYPEYEILVVNDGSSDDTLDQLVSAFGLEAFPEILQGSLETRTVRTVYRSRREPRLRVIDKENGGKADALNAATNLSRYPLVCSVDADSILQRDSLQRIVRPFLDDQRTVAAGGAIRVANGCKVWRGFLEQPGVPDSWLARFQLVEYLRAFLFGRTGWSALNAVTIVSGAFGVFRRSVLMEVGGYRTDTVGEDMELILRLQARRLRQKNKDRIVSIPDPVCWTQVPEDLASLRNQRIRWQRGLLESLTTQRRLVFQPRGRFLSWAALPFLWIVEALGPLIELAGYTLTLFLWLAGELDHRVALAFLVAAVGLGIMVSLMALLLEEISFRVYDSPSAFPKLLLAAVFENLGYRQLNSIWRLRGLWRFLRGQRHQWGAMQRRQH